MPTFNQSVPSDLYIEMMLAARELGVQRGAFVKQAIIEYTIRCRAALDGEEPPAPSADTESVCQTCHQGLPSNIPILVWPGGGGPYCSLRCADAEYLLTRLLHGDTMITPNGTEGGYIAPGQFDKRYKVTCQYCGSGIPPEVARVRTSTRRYYCATCTLPQDTKLLLELPPAGADPEQLIHLLKGTAE